MKRCFKVIWGFIKLRTFYDVVGVKTSYKDLFFEYYVTYDGDFDLFYFSQLSAVKKIDDEFKISIY